MTKFHVFAFSGNTMIMRLSLRRVSGPDDEKFAFFKSRTLYMPYVNQPVETLSGGPVDLASLKGDWLLVAPRDVVSHLMRSNVRDKCKLIGNVDVGLGQFEAEMANSFAYGLVNYINENWSHLALKE